MFSNNLFYLLLKKVYEADAIAERIALLSSGKMLPLKSVIAVNHSILVTAVSKLSQTNVPAC